ncbi:dihydropteroate synthase [Pollutimonas sp. M17]|uniref:dihydropteroate synthase n=1 Tax=Pollutimonas sp. M17 TaxID=2962065 RepID=UPI0021F3CCCB|nr:dihydropteroate synthase [Pollutimonas sp. M17]UYO94586.1 dihydropteroate synthase [Pollutimonas sp. M17]HWK69661.1 dihydropteroate synthase [Burkholderiaceae bacterium]
MSSSLLCGRFELNLGRPLIMGIVNVTPDSFSDGAAHFEADAAIAHAHSLIDQGADMLDIGGESTRPGAEPVSADDELARILPVIEALRSCRLPLSVDTFKPEVMRRVLDAGADMINDIYGFRRPGALQAVADSNCGLCIMHMQGEPKTMQQAPRYDDILAEVRRFLRERSAAALAAGIDRRRIVLDPGYGFGKTPAQNYQLLRQLPDVGGEGFPWLIGLSRKSMIGHVIGREPADRVFGSVAAALAAVARGAHIVRVHDVAATVDAVKVWRAIEFGDFL